MKAIFKLAGLPDAARITDREARRVCQAIVNALRAGAVDLPDQQQGKGAEALAATTLVAGDHVRVDDLGGGRWQVSVDIPRPVPVVVPSGEGAGGIGSDDIQYDLETHQIQVKVGEEWVMIEGGQAVPGVPAADEEE